MPRNYPDPLTLPGAPTTPNPLPRNTFVTGWG